MSKSSRHTRRMSYRYEILALTAAAAIVALAFVAFRGKSAVKPQQSRQIDDHHHCFKLIPLNKTWTGDWHALLTAKDSVVNIDGTRIAYPRRPKNYRFNKAGLLGKDKRLLSCQRLGRDEADDGVHVVILIISAATNFDNRTAIRQTWGKTARDHRGTSILFVVGKTRSFNVSQRLVDEGRKHRDILHVDLLDIRFNVAQKELAAIFWVSRNCPKATHILKTDDDVYVVVPNLLKFAGQQANFTRAIYGYDAGIRRPGANPNLILRRKSNLRDDFAPRRCYPFKAFPPYAVMSYLFSVDLVPEIVIAMRSGPFWAMDGDVFVSGILREVAKIHLASFNVFRVAYSRSKLSKAWLDDQLDNMDPIVIYENAMSGLHATVEQLTFIHQYIS